ncbi:RecX family transcriptional regulator [Candidatus Saccharibacteria bacterium]|nr:RecX family transcriptional regulator [Candidatus Saccharibacteria bacterium]
MPTITALTAQKRTEYVNVCVDDEFFCGLSLSDVARLRLHKGQTLSEQELEELKNLSSIGKAYTAALHYLSFRVRTIREVKDRLLQKGFADHVDLVIDRLVSEKYLNDSDFAERWVAMRIAQYKAPAIIRQELYRKGIESQTIDQAMLQYNDELIDTAIYEIAKKKSQQSTVSRQKLMAFIAGKGFGYDAVRRVLSQFESELSLS